MEVRVLIAIIGCLGGTLARAFSPQVRFALLPGAAIAMMVYASATAGTPSLEFGLSWIGSGLVFMLLLELRDRRRPRASVGLEPSVEPVVELPLVVMEGDE